MSASATIKVESVQAVEGVSKRTNKPYKKYVVHAADGAGEFSTFDGNLAQSAYALVGRRAQVVYDVGQFGSDLTDIRETEAAEDFRAVTEQGAPDWDLKDLRINRCAFWKEILGPAMQAGVAVWRAANQQAGPGELLTFVEGFGTVLRQVAEADVYSSKAPAGPDDRLPF